MRLSSIHEALSLSRARYHAQRGQSFGIITAWRSENNRATNNKRNQELLTDIKSLGLTATRVHGGYVEQTNDGPVHVHENSFFVFGHGISDAALYQHLLRLTRKYNQDSALFKPAEDFQDIPADQAALIHNDSGNTNNVGKLTPNNKESPYYTDIKGGSGKRQNSRSPAKFSFMDPKT